MRYRKMTEKGEECGGLEQYLCSGTLINIPQFKVVPHLTFNFSDPNYEFSFLL